MEALLDQCLISLVLDDMSMRERMDVIVVNDGSTDGSSVIAHRYVNKYPEMFSVIEKANGNYGSCVNAALPCVKGKYVRILDADDSYVTANLNEYLCILECQNVDLVLNNYETIESTGNIVSKKEFEFKTNQIFKFSEISPDTFLPMHAVAYRADIFKEINYKQTEGISYTDMEWVFHPMIKVERVYFFDKPIYSYLLGREGQTVEFEVKMKRVSHTVKSLEKQLQLFKNIPNTIMAYQYMERLLFRRAAFVYLASITNNAQVDLAELDNLVKECSPSLYNRLAMVKSHVNRVGVSLPVIKMWRNPFVRFFMELLK